MEVTVICTKAKEVNMGSCQKSKRFSCQNSTWVQSNKTYSQFWLFFYEEKFSNVYRDTVSYQYNN